MSGREDDEAAEPELGELQFTRRRVTSLSWLILFAGAIVFLESLVDPELSMPAQLVLFGVSLALCAVFAWHLSSVAEFHEGGLRQRSPLRSRTIAWKDVATFSLETIAFADGFLLVLEGDDGSRLRVRTRLPPERDALLMGIVSALAFAEAGRMSSALARGVAVPLGPHARLTREGLEVLGKSFGEGGEPRVLPWERIAGEAPDLGGVHFFAVGEDKPVLRVFKSTPGLLPALQVIRDRCARSSESYSARAQDDDEPAT